MTTENPTYSIFILSDSTGETAVTMIRAALVQYAEKDINIVRCKNIRTEDQVRAVIDDCFNKRGMVAYTFASPMLRKKTAEICIERSIPALDFLGPLINTLDHFFGVPSSSQVGALRQTDDMYFKRIEAIEYTVRHDDGKTYNELDKADIVLVGISRTSKTPLSVFLSHKGWKVANVPLLLNQPLPPELAAVDQRKIIGLTISSEALQRIRRKRMETMGAAASLDYASPEYVTAEIEF